MNSYLVGGAVRDSLLGLPVTERDWVVVGATPQQMIDQGFTLVGRDFPVFLHPQTHEEYALARTERSIGPGYRGFEIHTSPKVTLEEDLARRDLTINAMARGGDGRLIDPFGGQADLEGRWLRHVSPAFAEDPVRILRVARFAARLAPLGFQLAQETQDLMRRMVEAGEVAALVPERVWQEMEKALLAPAPTEFFQILRCCGALGVLFPELEALYGVPQPQQYHPEIDTGIHTFMVLDQAAMLSPDPMVRFAALMHDLGKALTPREMLPSHRGHEEKGVPLVEALCARYRIPNRFRDLACVVTRHHGNIHRALELRPSTLARLMEQMDLYRRPERLESVLLACEADYRGRSGFEHRPYPQGDYLRGAFACSARLRARDLMHEGLEGPALGEELHRRRVAALSSYREQAAVTPTGDA